MTILATNTVGEYGVPGVGVFGRGETREVPLDVAAQLSGRPEFRVTITDPADLPLHDATGEVRYLGYTGPVDSRFGYGGAGITILRALSRLGVEVAVNAHHDGLAWEPNRQDLPADAAGQLVRRPWLPRVELMHSVPRDFNFARAPIKIGWTMWETDRIPAGDTPIARQLGDWSTILNAVDALIVPCQHNADVFAANGITRPITVLPYGMDVDVWPYVERPERDTFTVVQYGDLTSRKAPEEAVTAFQMAFPVEQNVRLVLKTQRGLLASYARVADAFRDPRVLVVDATWTRAQLVQMLHEADCFVWLSRGEGFGLPPLQALLTGLPVVTTTHSGMAAYYRPQFFHGVRSAGMSDSPMGGQWYEPDVEHAAEQLRKVYDDRRAAFRRAKAGASYARNHFSLDAFARRLGTYLANL